MEQASEEVQEKDNSIFKATEKFFETKRNKKPNCFKFRVVRNSKGILH